MQTQYSRIPIAAAKHLGGNEYKLLDYLLFRHALDEWKFWVKDIISQTGISRCHTLRLLKSFRQRSFIIQDKNRHYHVNYPAIETWIRSQNETTIRSHNETRLGAKMRPIQERKRKEIKERIKNDNVQVSTNTAEHTYPNTNVPSVSSPTTSTRQTSYQPESTFKVNHNTNLGDEFERIMKDTETLGGVAHAIAPATPPPRIKNQDYMTDLPPIPSTLGRYDMHHRLE